MANPQRCSFSKGVGPDHVAHLWCWSPKEDGTWLPVGEKGVDELGVFSCDGRSEKAKAVANV